MRALGILLFLAAGLLAEEELVCRVSYVAADGIYVDAGTKQGVAEGDAGRVLQNGVEIARVQVVAVSSGSARLSVVSRSTDATAAAGDRVQLRVSPAAAKPAPAPGTKKDDADETFVPLLERQNGQAKITQKSNIAHGWISVRQVVQTGLTDYWTTVVGTGGSVDRLGGAPWTLRWSGNLSARGGDGFDGSTLEGARLDLYELSLTRRLDKEGSLVRVGRFLPHQLRGVGFLDGGQAEIVLSDHVRVGGLLGFKPTRDDLAPSADEPTFGAYATLTSGKRGDRYYSGTWGVLGAMFDGDLDRLAVIVDQLFEPSRSFRIRSSAEIDFDVDAAMFRSDGVRLTRFDLIATADLRSTTRVRTGVDHWERLDNMAERTIIGALVDATSFDRGSWRYFAGLTQELPWQLTVNIELAVINSPDTDDTPHVTLGITRRGIFGLEHGSITLTLYNLEGSGVDGTGGLVSAYLPFAQGRWVVLPAIGFRMFDAGTGMSGDFDVTDIRIHVEHRASAKWSFHAAISHLMGDGVDATQGELGLRYRW